MTGTARKALAEALATFLFVLAIIAAVNSGSPLTPLAIGFTLMVLVFSTGHISGAHLNPAVSVGVFLRGGLSVADFISYLIAQFVGGALAALVSMSVWPVGEKAMIVEVGPAFPRRGALHADPRVGRAHTATSKDTAGNSFYGLAIGATVFVGAATVGSISGGGFNPAVALGPLGQRSLRLELAVALPRRPRRRSRDRGDPVPGAQHGRRQEDRRSGVVLRMPEAPHPPRGCGASACGRVDHHDRDSGADRNGCTVFP